MWSLKIWWYKFFITSKFYLGRWMHKILIKHSLLLQVLRCHGKIILPTCSIHKFSISRLCVGITSLEKFWILSHHRLSYQICYCWYCSLLYNGNCINSVETLWLTHFWEHNNISCFWKWYCKTYIKEKGSYFALLVLAATTKTLLNRNKKM